MTTYLPRSYYLDKTAVLADLFGATQVNVEQNCILVDGFRFPVVDDVIVLLPADRYTTHINDSIGAKSAQSSSNGPFATDVQDTFGAEWQAFPEMLAEHQTEFRQYFDLIDIDLLEKATVCDLGCGSGRWSYFLRDRCRQLILVDFSDAIFIARSNLRDRTDALFFMGDLTDLPFRNQFADLVICLRVLHHLPTPALEAVRRLKPFAPRILIYLYYALDNRPPYFRWLLAVVTGLRQLTSRIKGSKMRRALSWVLTLTLYAPVIFIGRCMAAIGFPNAVPLHEIYRGKSLRRIRQDVYDRFFTRIEQRVTRTSIAQLDDAFGSVVISPNLPYWHFVCESDSN